MKDQIISALHTIQGSTGSSYVVKGRIKNGPVKSITIGKTSTWSLKQARTEAQKILLELSQGFDRNQARKQRQAEEAAREARSITLRQALAKYLELKATKATTKNEYRLVIEREFMDWLDKPITSITKAAVAERYLQIIKNIKTGKTHSKGKTNTTEEYAGIGSANHAKRILSAVLGYFVGDVDDPDDPLAVISSNPVVYLSKKKLVRPLKPRTKQLNGPERRAIIEECRIVRHPEYKEDGLGLTVNEADFTALLMLLACRRGELRMLKWSDIRWPESIGDVGTITFKDTKNGQDHTLALTPIVSNLLKARLQESNTKAGYVFPSKQKGKEGKPISIGRIVELVSKKLKIEGLTAHVLRRTTANIANDLGFDMATIKKLLNHSASGVTEIHYVQSSKKRLLEMQLAIEAEICNEGEPPEAADFPTNNLLSEQSSRQPEKSP